MEQYIFVSLKETRGQLYKNLTIKILYLDPTPKWMSYDVNYRTKAAQPIECFIDTMLDIIVPVCSNLNCYGLRDVENNVVARKLKKYFFLDQHRAKKY